MLKTENFNNRLIKDMIGNEMVNKAFLEFLNEDAEEEVKYSRIHDKQSHYEAIELYKKLLQNASIDKKFNSESFGLDADKIDEK